MEENVSPSSTFFYNQWAISDLESIFDFTSRQEYAKATYSDYIKKRDEEWMDFMKEYAERMLYPVCFSPKDSADRHPCAIMSIAVKDEKCRQSVICKTCSMPLERKDAPPVPQTSPNCKQYPRARNIANICCRETLCLIDRYYGICTSHVCLFL